GWRHFCPVSAVRHSHSLCRRWRRDRRPPAIPRGGICRCPAGGGRQRHSAWGAGRAVIQFDNVSKRYPGGFEALSGLSFYLDQGEFAFLTGHSGAGKSTLLKLIMLMERPTQGQVLINSKNLNRLHHTQVPYFRRRVGVVFQNHHLLFDRSVYDNVALPLEVMGFPRTDIPRRVRAALDKVGLLSKEKQNPITLSTGEQQRVGIARAVVHKPKILLADEPTGNLDPGL